MRRLQIGFVVVSFAVGGCASSSPSQAAASASAAAAPAASSAAAAPAASSGTVAPVASSGAASLVDLSPLTISFRGKLIARLFADGRTESAGQNAPGTVLLPGPTLRADGTMQMTRGGVTARLDDKGEIHVIEPTGAQHSFGRIVGDELHFAGSELPWSVRVRGNLIEFGKDNSSVIDGDVTPGMRHTALLMAAAFTIDNAITGH